jgi:putative ABC transport system substrate-binding protein
MTLQARSPRQPKEQPDGVIVLPSPMLYSAYGDIAGAAARDRLPAIGAAREFADVGGLISYSVNLPDLARQTAIFIDKIAELPVELPTKFELVTNLRAAKDLGLTISHAFLLVVEDVIE